MDRGREINREKPDAPGEALFRRRILYRLSDDQKTQQAIVRQGEILDNFTTNQIKIIKETYLTALERISKGHFFSPMELSCIALLPIIGHIQSSFPPDYEPPAFQVLYDFAFGMELVTGRLIRSVKDDASQSKKQANTLAKHVLQVMQVNRSLLLKKLYSQAEADRQILREDLSGSGFSLVDSIIEDTRRYDPTPILLGRFVTSGAEAAGKMYKTIYPIAEQALKQKA